MFHRHKWLIVGSNYTAPQTRSMTLKGDEMPAIFQLLVQGATHVYLRCDGCGDFAYRSMPGNMPVPAVMPEWKT